MKQGRRPPAGGPVQLGVLGVGSGPSGQVYGASSGASLWITGERHHRPGPQGRFPAAGFRGRTHRHPRLAREPAGPALWRERARGPGAESKPAAGAHPAGGAPWPARGPSCAQGGSSQAAGSSGSAPGTRREESFLRGFPNTPLVLVSAGALPPARRGAAACVPRVTGAPGAQSPTVSPRCYRGPGLLPAVRQRLSQGGRPGTETGPPCCPQRTERPL